MLFFFCAEASSRANKLASVNNITGNRPTGANAATLVAPSNNATNRRRASDLGEVIGAWSRADEEGVQPAAVRTQHLKAQSFKFDGLVAFRDPAQMIQDEAGNGIAFAIAELRTEGDVEIFRDECRLTYLHELGHYLGWDEDDLTARGLD